jgi:hypothetical protein
MRAAGRHTVSTTDHRRAPGRARAHHDTPRRAPRVERRALRPREDTPREPREPLRQRADRAPGAHRAHPGTRGGLYDTKWALDSGGGIAASPPPAAVPPCAVRSVAGARARIGTGTHPTSMSGRLDTDDRRSPHGIHRRACGPSESKPPTQIPPCPRGSIRRRIAGCGSWGWWRSWGAFRRDRWTLRQRRRRCPRCLPRSTAEARTRRGPRLRARPRRSTRRAGS